VYDRAADVFPPREDDQAVANRDGLVLDGIGEAGIVAGDDLDGQLAARSER